MSNQNPVNYSIVNPATRQILDLPDPNHAILRSPYVDNHAPAIHLLPLIAFNRKTHECKLLLECRRVNNQGVEEHALETFEVGKDINWRSIGRQTGFLHFPDVIKLMYVRTSGELHSIRVLLIDEGIALSVLSINAWDDMYLVNNGLPRDVHFNLLKACFIEWDDCLAIAEIIGLDLHLLKMTKYDGGDLRWSEQKRIVPLTFLNTEPYSKERDQISPAIFQSTVLWFNFRRRMSFSYDVKAKRINKIELPRPKRELFDTVTKFQHFPSLVKLQGMRPDQGNYQWYEDRISTSLDACFTSRLATLASRAPLATVTVSSHHLESRRSLANRRTVSRTAAQVVGGHETPNRAYYSWMQSRRRRKPVAALGEDEVLD
ncbi:hypothetical protein F8388_006918 [Cannabis sativa]|uniref:Uncharacterized protein n=1 Tax=Cannabis sativa TaxID=3483 RepID=A0A7J6HTF4_CANSA|nr:hypothetical protein F8388_006918 [Cannabis sativa]KAF4398019.1 hypothetical protein G4B88_019740 [Cannabis sativa]